MLLIKMRLSLMYLGLLPFLGLVFLLHSFPWVQNMAPTLNQPQLITLLLNYSFAISAFMAAVHWGQHFFVDTPFAMGLLLASNVHLLLLVFGFSFLTDSHFIVGCILLLLSVLGIDWLLFKRTIIDKAYFIARAVITTCVCVMLISVTGEL